MPLGAGPAPRPEPAAAVPEPTQIAARVGRLAQPAGPGAGPEELLASIIATPAEQLIPWESCTLPSGGRYYNWPDGTIKVRAMGQVAEKVLATHRLAQSGQSIDYLLRECCQFPGEFNPEQLLVGDSMYLLYYLRGITHGNEYEFAVPCPNPECEQLGTHKYDINELAGTVQRGPEAGDEPFRVDLPYMSQVVGQPIWAEVRFLRKLDINRMVAKKKHKDKRQQGGRARPGGNPLQRKLEQANEQVVLDDTLTENLEQVLLGFNGVRNPMTTRSFIQKLHATDTATIREWLRLNTPGIDTTVRIACPDCQHEFTVELPITDNFFRPQKPSRVRA